MAAHTRVALGYNVQVAVDTKHKLIVEQQVTNQVVDMGLLTQTAEPAKEVLGVETIAVVADKGYFKIEDIEACEKAAMEPYVPRPQRGPSVQGGFVPQGRVSLRPGQRQLPLPRGSASSSLFIFASVWTDEDQLH
jgi:Transposase DDE domain